jgi:hypothetical protein
MGPIVSPKLGEDICDVALDGVLCNGELVGDRVGFRAVNGAGKNQEPKDRRAQGSSDVILRNGPNSQRLALEGSFLHHDRSGS